MLRSILRRTTYRPRRRLTTRRRSRQRQQKDFPRSFRPRTSCGIGLFVAVGLGQYRRGLLTISSALLYFVVVKAFVMSDFGIFMSEKGGSYGYRTHYEQMIPFSYFDLRLLHAVLSEAT